MHREYHIWHSKHLDKDMELLVFGYAGSSVLLFPTRCARFFDYENWDVLEGIRPKIEAGELQVYCVDSLDKESIYNREISPEERIKRHQQYEAYILNEVLSFMKTKNPDSILVSAGCSMGAYHAVNLAFRHPWLFSKVVGMSGRYDLSFATGNFIDLFDGYWNQDIYFNMPTQYMANLSDECMIHQMQKLEIVLAMGKEDQFLENNLLLSKQLHERGIGHSLYLWDGEAHKPWYWKMMLQEYL